MVSRSYNQNESLKMLFNDFLLDSNINICFNVQTMLALDR